MLRKVFQSSRSTVTEIGLPVHTEVQIGAAIPQARIQHLAFDDLERADIPRTVSGVRTA